MTRKIKTISLYLFCIYIIAVILLCVIHTDNIPELPKYFLGIPIDKIAHMIMFLPFVILSYFAVMPTEKGIWRKLAVLSITVLLGGIFAFSTERLQAMTGYRTYEISDMIADVAGIALSTIIVLIHIIKTR